MLIAIQALHAMPKIVTLTLNPALDIAPHVERLMPAHKMRCHDVRRDPGGGGINVARAVHRLGGETLAVYAAGGSSGDEIQNLLAREGLRQRPVRVAAPTRESFNIFEDSTGQQYRFVLPGEPLSRAEGERCIAEALAVAAPGDYLVASGSLPPGLPAGFYAEAFGAAKGVRTVIDAQGEALRLVLDHGVGIVKASAREMGEYLGTAPQDVRDWRDALAALVRSGKAGVAVVTLGEQGSVLAGEGRAWRAEVPPVKSSTTVGAGDSFLGGLLVKLSEGAALDAALRFAAAAGTAALLTTGTGLCQRADVDRLLSAVTISEL